MDEKRILLRCCFYEWKSSTAEAWNVVVITSTAGIDRCEIFFENFSVLQAIYIHLNIKSLPKTRVFMTQLYVFISRNRNSMSNI